MDETPDAATRGVARPSPWLFALVYAAHLLDEYLAPPGLAPWSVEQFELYFTVELWLAINVASFALLLAAVWLVARGAWPSWVLVTLAVHVALHALMHLAASAWAASLSPGLWSGLLLAAPLAAWTLRWARRGLDARVVAYASLLGIATFQPFLDLLVRLALGFRWWV